MQEETCARAWSILRVTSSIKFFRTSDNFGGPFRKILWCVVTLLFPLERFRWNRRQVRPPCSKKNTEVSRAHLLRVTLGPMGVDPGCEPPPLPLPSPRNIPRRKNRPLAWEHSGEDTVIDCQPASPKQFSIACWTKQLIEMPWLGFWTPFGKQSSVAVQWMRPPWIWAHGVSKKTLQVKHTLEKSPRIQKKLPSKPEKVIKFLNYEIIQTNIWTRPPPKKIRTLWFMKYFKVSTFGISHILSSKQITWPNSARKTGGANRQILISAANCWPRTRWFQEHFTRA